MSDVGLTISLFPGNYTIPKLKISQRCSLRVLGCLDCGPGADGAQSTFVALEAPPALVQYLNPIIDGENIALIFRDITLHLVENPVTHLRNTLSLAIFLDRSDIRFERVVVRDILLVENQTEGCALLGSRSLSNFVFKDVIWVDNEIQTDVISDQARTSGNLMVGPGTLNNVTVDNNWVENNVIAVFSGAGGIIGEADYLSVRNSNFRNNQLIGTVYAHGGVISEFSNLHLDNCTFINNSAMIRSGESPYWRNQRREASGGAISLYAGGIFSITNSTFIGNSAPEGGAIAIKSGFTMRAGISSLSNLYFKHNHATSLGSAIFVNADSLWDTISIRNVTLEDNTSIQRVAEVGAFAPCAIFARDLLSISFIDITVVHDRRFKLPSVEHTIAHRTAVMRVSLVTFDGILFQELFIGNLAGDFILVQDSQTVVIERIREVNLTDSSTTIPNQMVRSWIMVDADADVTLFSSTCIVRDMRVISNTHTTAAILHIRNTNHVSVQSTFVQWLSTRPERALIFLHNARTVRVIDITVYNSAGSIIIQESTDATLQDIHVSHSGGQLPAIELSSVSNVNLKRIKMEYLNGQGLKVTDVTRILLSGSEFTDCMADDQDGGAVFLSGVSITEIDNCNFYRNKASNGGAIYAWDSGFISNSRFYNNSASLAGGAMYTTQNHLEVFSSYFEGNMAPSGGAVFQENEDSLWHLSTFVGNEAASSGGAVQFNGRKRESIISTHVIECSFVDNYARISGGAINIELGFLLSVTKSNFTGNVAGPREIFELTQSDLADFQPLFGLGGAVNVVGPTKIAGCLFEANVANAGGALYVASSDYFDSAGLSISESTFLSNIASHSGGAVVLDTRPLMASPRKPLGLPPTLHRSLLSNSTFTINIAYYYGGALAMLGYRLNLSCGNNEFSSNNARYGAALYYNGDREDWPVPAIYSQFFRNNVALSGGVGFVSHLNQSASHSDWRICSRCNSCKDNLARGYAPILASGSFFLSWAEPTQYSPAWTKPIAPLPPFTGPPVPFLPPNQFENSTCSGFNFPGHVPSARMETFHELSRSFSTQAASSSSTTGASADKRYMASSRLEEQHRASKMSYGDVLSELNPTNGRLPSISELSEEFTRQYLSKDTSDASYNPHIGKIASLTSTPLRKEPQEGVLAYINFYGPIDAHSGINRHIFLQAIDQFSQVLRDERNFPLSVTLSSDNEPCPSPTQCSSIALDNVGNAPVMSDGSVDLDINLVLEPHVDPRQKHEVNVTISFSGVSPNSPMSWLRDMRIKLGMVISRCPEGYGFAGPGKPFCQACPFASYNLNGDGTCVSCADEPRLQCYGKTLTTSENYWIYADRKTNRASAYLCPSGYCLGKFSECAPHRTGILCSACDKGFSESLFSACTKCDRTNWFLVVIAFLLLWVAVLVIHTIIAASSGKSTILFYFGQTALMLASDTPFPWGRPNPNSSLCLFPLTPLYRRVLFTILPLIMLLQLLATFALHRFFMRFIRPILPPRLRCCTPLGLEPSGDYEPLESGEETNNSDTKPLFAGYPRPYSGKLIKKNGYVDNGVTIPRRSTMERSDSFSSVEPSYTAHVLAQTSDLILDSQDNNVPIAGVRLKRTSPATGDLDTEFDSDLDSCPSESGSIYTESSTTSSRRIGSEETDTSEPSDIMLLPRGRKEKLVLLGPSAKSPMQVVDDPYTSSSTTPGNSDVEFVGEDMRGDSRSRRRHADIDHLDKDGANEIVVPAFGFELSEEEESAMSDAEMNDWNTTMEPTSSPSAVSNQTETDRSAYHPNDMIGAPQTLAGLRKWVQEKRFFHHYRLIRTVIALTLFTYSSATQLSFTLFDCENIRGGPTFLKIEPSILCNSATYHRWRFSLLALVPFMFVIFCAITFKLFSGHFKGKLSQADVRYGVLYEMYKPGFFFWKIIELLRRSVLIATFVFINKSAITRGLTLSGTCFIILVAQALAWPYRRKLENSLETLSTFILSVIAIASIWHKKDSTGAAAAIIWILIFLTSFIIVVAFAVSTLRRRLVPRMKWALKAMRKKGTQPPPSSLSLSAPQDSTPLGPQER